MYFLKKFKIKLKGKKFSFDMIQSKSGLFGAFALGYQRNPKP